MLPISSLNPEMRFALICEKGGGGGGGTGAVSYPAYMQNWHGQMLNHGGADTIISSITDVMNAALTTNPFLGVTYYTGTTEIAAIQAALTRLEEAVTTYNLQTKWDALLAAELVAIPAPSTIVASGVSAPVIPDVLVNVANTVEAFRDVLDRDLTAKVYPLFNASMRDINSIMSSAYPIGLSQIVEGRDAQLAKYDAELRHKATLLEAEIKGRKELTQAELEVRADQIEAELKLRADSLNEELKLKRHELVQSMSRQLLAMFVQEDQFKRDLEKAFSAARIEANRLMLVANREGVQQNIDVRNTTATWDLEVFQYGANLLAAIGGGTATPGGQKMSKTQSVLGGVFSGAAMGAAVGGAPGAAIGGIIGGVAGLLS